MPDIIAKQDKIFFSLKLVKFLGVFFMVLNHSILWLVLERGFKFRESFLFLLPYFEKLSFLGFFNFLLPIAAGAMLRVRLNKYIINNEIRYPFKKIIGPLLSLFFLGMIYNSIVWGSDCMFNWNLLQFLSLSYLLIFFISKININLLYFISVPILFLSSDIHWSLFPWFTIVVYGFFIFDFYYRLSSEKFKLFLISTIIFNLIFFFLFGSQFLFKINLQDFWAPIFRPDRSVPFLILLIFSLITLISLFIKTQPRKYGLINCFSGGILWIYILHSFLSNRLPHLFIGKTFAPNTDFLIFLTILLLFYLSFSWVIGLIVVKISQKRVFVSLRKIR